MDKTDDIFRKAMAGGHQDTPDEAMALWENGFAKKVARQNFYKFGFAHLNVFTVATVAYTVVSLVALFIGSAYYLARTADSDSFSNPPSSENQLQEKSFLVDSCDAKSYPHTTAGNTSLKRSNNFQSKNDRDSMKKNNSSIDSTLLSPLQSNSEKVIEENSIQLIPSDNQHQSEKKVSVVKVVKKTIFIEKRDTLQTVDTIRSKKEWKRIKKNN